MDKSMKRNLLIAGALLFWLGILVQLFLSGAVAWGEIEARVYVPQIGDPGLDLRCPIMLSPVESGTISASIRNTLDEDTSPVVISDISRASGDQQVSQTLSLAAHETQTVHWKVDTSDVVYGKLILVNVTQMRYSDLPSQQGTCGIFILNFPGLSGVEAFYLLLALSLAGILLGGILWLRGHEPLDDLKTSMATASGTLAGFATAGMLTALLRWWGLILFFDAVALIIFSVIFTEFIIFPRDK